MREEILKQFFEGKVSEAALCSDLHGSVSESDNVSRFKIEDMETEFTVKPSHLIKICDLGISGRLSPKQLETIGFCLQTSDAFEWDVDTDPGNRVADIVFYLSCPDINYELSTGNIAKFKDRLMNGGNPFE